MYMYTCVLLSQTPTAKIAGSNYYETAHVWYTRAKWARVRVLYEVWHGTAPAVYMFMQGLIIVSVPCILCHTERKQ